jgi:hypothetical protein
MPGFFPARQGDSMAKQKTVIERPAGEDSALASNVQVLPALPGENEKDDDLVDAAVAEINRAWVSGHLQAARKVGELVINTFFGGDAQNAHSRSRKHQSYKALSEREDLKLSSTDLWYSVAIYEHFPLLGEELALSLTVGHHRQLVHVKDIEQRTTYAQKAAADGLTVKELRSAIKDMNKEVPADTPRRGRPTLPVSVKTMKEAQRGLKVLQRLAPDQVKDLNDVVRARVLADAKKLAEEVASWWTALQDLNAEQTQA